MKTDLKEIENRHISVLLNELVDSISINNKKKNVIVDMTLGMGGHASKIIEKMNKGDIFIGFDADIKNLEMAKIRLNKINKDDKVVIILINSNFVNLKKELSKKGIDSITGIYYDLGLSSLHLDEAGRGFSFMLDGPLDMRLDKTRGKTAADIVNGYTQAELREIFLKYGEEPGANKIASKIVDARKTKKFKTTKDLSDVIGGIPKTKSRIFQAIRIEVNEELKNLETSLNDAIDLLELGGTIFVISFHSLEDRITKNIFKNETRDCICRDIICSCGHKKSLKILTKKPIIPSDEEIKSNSRSRSAKARCAEKIK
ncbi:MAG: 16S rRNA (cytosine(1402)-N(4))-methyltransferase RsmH [Candidatus Gracilibacteria bacterium]|nr:16S rRNA (cytosine(1402)-N(4))-methyltransferase RsmH [Candidatus Gracilibacteria bacterium]